MDSDTRNTLLRQIYAIYDVFAGDLAVACHKGCAACCTRNVTMTSLEGGLMICHLAESNPHWRTALLETVERPRFHPQVTINQLAQLCAMDEEIPEETIDPRSGPCPLLADDSCPVYDVRPLGCRAMVSKTLCPENGAAEMPDFVLTVNNVFLQYIEAIDHQGISGNLIDMLLHLSSDPSDFVDIRNLRHRPSHLLPNHPIPVLMIPPEHRQRMQPLLEAIQAEIKRYY